MTGKIKTEIAVGIILAVAVLIGGSIWLGSRMNDSDVEMDAGGASVKVNGNNVDVKAPGTRVKVDGNNVEIGSATNSPEKATTSVESTKKKSNTVLIFDASGSMAKIVQGKSMLAIAKESVGTFVDSLDKAMDNLSVVVYGHKGSSSQANKSISCQGIEEIYFMGAVDPALVKSKIATFSSNGWTPIADSLEKAKGILSASNFEGAGNSVILVSDGEETCGGDPVKKAQELCQAKIKVVTNVIGFNVSGAEEAQLKAIANAGCGTYYPVKNEQELNNAFVKIKGTTIDINDGAGTKVHVDDNNVNVNAPGAKVDVKNDTNVNVTAPGASIKVDGDNVKVKVPGVDVNL